MITKGIKTEGLRGSQMHEMLNFYSYLADLKSLYRQGWIKHHGLSQERSESVAEHIFSGAIFAYIFAREYFPELDAQKVLVMYLFHDLAEARAGDITPHEKVDLSKHHNLEAAAFEAMLGSFAHGREYIDHWVEYEAQVTCEAKFVKAVDRLDAVMLAKVYEMSGWITRESSEEFTSRLEELDDLPQEIIEIVAQLQGLSGVNLE